LGQPQSDVSDYSVSIEFQVALWEAQTCEAHFWFAMNQGKQETALTFYQPLNVQSTVVVVL
jgi:hypothetical protein